MRTRIPALVVACVAVAAASLALPWTPSYDPWAWLVWGRDAAHLGLTFGAAPSWKPLPVLFTSVLSLTGGAGPALWVVVARAGALLAVVMCVRLAMRWAAPPLGPLAGLAAAAGLLLTGDYVRRSAVANAEPLMVAAALLAVERHLEGRRGQALALAVAAALVRPEAGIFVVLYAAWLWRDRVLARRWIAAAVAVLPVLWLGGPLLAVGNPLQASTAALGRVPIPADAATQHHGLRVFSVFGGMLPVWVLVAAGLAIVLALPRRAPGRGPVLALAAVALAWTTLIALMAQRGYAGLPRYLFMPAALTAILAGLGIARACTAVGGLRLAPRLVAATVAAFAVVAAMSVASAQRLAGDASAVVRDAARNRALAAAIDRAGGADAILDCGSPVVPWYATSAAAWSLGVNLDQVHARARPSPGVVFAYRHGTWRVLDACRSAESATDDARRR